MLIRSMCSVILMKLCLVLLPMSTLGLDESLQRHHHRAGQHKTGDLEFTNHVAARNDGQILWPVDTPSRNRPILFPREKMPTSNENKRKTWRPKGTIQGSPNRKLVSRHSKNRDAHQIKNSNSNKNKDAHQNLNTHRNKKTETLNFPTPVAAQGIKDVQADLPINHSKKNKGASHFSRKKNAHKGKKGIFRKGGKGDRKTRKPRSVKLVPKKFNSFQNFGMNLHVAVSNLSQKSFVMSPFSAWSALILAYYGSNGQTGEQLETALGVQKKQIANIRANALTKLLEDPKSGAILRTSNKAYVANDMVLKPKVSKNLNNIEHLDFRDETKSCFHINNEVANITEGKITELVKPGDIDASTRFALVNAVYFKGKWLHPFDKKETMMKPFYDHNGNLITNVDMMKTTAYFRLGRLENREGQLLEMRYLDSTVVMHIVLPNKHIDIRTLVQSLDQEAFVNALKTTRELKADVTLPKFKLETRLEDNLEQAIRSLGITDMFDNPDFSAFTGKNEVANVKIVQQAVIEIDEEGTEAAAATMVAGFRMYTVPEPFIADRPFAFYINEEKTQVTIFSGIYMGPNAVENI